MRYYLRRISRFITLFVVLILSLQIFVWQVVNLPQITELLSKQISFIFTQQFNAKVTFSKISFQLFPLGPVIHQLKIKGSIDDKRNYQAYFQESSLYLAPIDWLTKKNPIKGLKFSDGYISYNDAEFFTKKDNDQTPKEILQDLLNLIENKNNIVTALSLPKMSVYVEKVLFYSNFLDCSMESLNVESLKDNIYIAANLNGIKLLTEDQSSNKSKSVDFTSLQLSADIFNNKLKIHDFRIYRQFSWNHLFGTLHFAANKPMHISMLSHLNCIDLAPNITDAFGQIRSEIIFSGLLRSPKIQTKLDITQLETKWAHANKLHLTAQLESHQLVLQSLKYEHNDGILELLENKPIATLNKNDWKLENILSDSLNFKIENLQSASIFRFLNGDLDPLIGKINANLISVNLKDEKLNINFPQGLDITDFKLDFSKNHESPFFSIPSMHALAGQVNVNLKGGVQIQTSLLFGKNKLPIVGTIDEKGVNFISEHALVALEDFGPFGNVPLSGTGKNTIKVKGPSKDVVLSFTGDLKNLRVLGMRLGDTQGTVHYGLNTSILECDQLQSNYQQSKFNLSGLIDFNDAGRIEVAAVLENSNMNDISEMFDPIFKNALWIKEQYLGKMKASLRLEGTLDPDTFSMEGEVESSLGFLFEESFDSLKYKVNYDKKLLSFSDIDWLKKNPFMTGNFQLNLDSKWMNVKLKFHDTKLNQVDNFSDWNSVLQGKIHGDLAFSGHEYDLNGQNEFILSELRIHDKFFGTSYLTLHAKNGEYTFNLDFLNDLIKVRAHSNRTFAKRNVKNSDILIDVMALDMNQLLSLVDVENLQEKNLSGSLKMSAFAQFSFEDWKTMDLSLNIKDFYLKKDKFYLSIMKNHSKAIIRNGHLDKWNILLDGSGGRIESTGVGDISKKFILATKGQFQSKYLEILRPSMESSRGLIYFDWSMGVSPNSKKEYSFHSKASGVNIFDPKSKTLFENITYSMSVLDNQLLLDHFNAQLGGGQVFGNGEIQLNFPNPSIKLNFNFKEAAISLFNKNKIVFSGNGNISGITRPYKVNADISLIKSEFFNEFDDYQSSSTSVPSFYRFIPNIEILREKPIIVLDIKFDTLWPIHIKNSLLEMELVGPGTVQGPVDAIKLGGNFELGPKLGRFFFKNNDFILKKGEVKFQSDSPTINPLLDFHGVTQIGEYAVNLKVTGPAKNFEMALSSEPTLPEKDIFSLLTLGVTNQNTPRMADEERKSLATMGLGSVLMEKLNLNKGIESSLGLKVSMNTEMNNDNSAFINDQGNVGINTSNVRKYSTNKIEIQKELGPKLNVGTSFSLGGAGQGRRDEMNLNYILTPNLSMQSLYERKTGMMGQEQEMGIGLDFRFKWTFK